MSSNHYWVHWLAPVATLVASSAQATIYLSVVEAQAVLFPGENLVSVPVVLSVEQAKEIEKTSGIKVRDKSLKIWRASGGGWFYLDQVLGKHEMITYAVALTADGVVNGIEILEYRETWGDEIRNPQWRAQFKGKKLGAPLKLDNDIVNLSGATLSCRHVTDGVRRLLATHAVIASNF